MCFILPKKRVVFSSFLRRRPTPHPPSQTLTCSLCVCLTLTRSSGNCPREFSGTLIGGMTQSLFTRLTVPSPLTIMLRHGNKISGRCWVSIASPCFTCKHSRQASCTEVHTQQDITSEEDAATHQVSDLHLPTPREQAHYHVLTNIPHFMKLISTLAAQKITQQMI